MAKYRKRPVIVEAVQWNGFYSEPKLDCIEKQEDNDISVSGICAACGMPRIDHGCLPLDRTAGFERLQIVCPGDWIVTHDDQSHSVYKPNVFKEKYDPADEDRIATVHLCNTCKKHCANCDGKPVFGTGVSSDNVYECYGFERAQIIQGVAVKED